ncbi:GNAT family N-acetyltransferase [Marinobacterium arenosum]|uniref:GNAT family N-acetyltransferase n=1 Tax=Marinobacterium arenosum TaxID=2862496 RepID=UPI001C9584C2|nr:GNAT family N-acetyltransferase [Marinobacterium arenosum]MBY4675831.1 GNAT family N-acetyltransferase [Marinobacterium arenosum]
MSIQIRRWRPDDSVAIHQLFHASVQQLAAEHYSAEQRAAWASPQLDLPFWQQRLAQTRPWIAEIEQRLAGFAELIPADSYIDCIYVHPDHAGRGVGSALLEHLLSEARSLGLRRLDVDVSETALPLFRKFDFAQLQPNRLERNGIELVNWRMQKQL